MNKNCWKCTFFVERSKQLWEEFGISGVCVNPTHFKQVTIWNPASTHCGHFDSLADWFRKETEKGRSC